MLERAARDVESGGAVAAVLAGHEADPGPSALALRLLGGIHRLVLTGAAPDLARHYPSAGGDDPDAERAWPAFLHVVETQADAVRAALRRGVQTNEVGRAGALVGGFLSVARDTRLPLRVYELGASAGLNLRWDRFRYAAGDRSWGDPRSPVDLGDPYEGGVPPLHVQATVVARAGCDRAPVDATTADGRLTLLSYAWPDMTRRLVDLEGALAIAAEVPAPVERAGAAEWLRGRLAADRAGTATVVYHSVVMQYVDEVERGELDALFEDAGARASSDEPLARLSFEPANRTMEVRLRTWPGGSERLLAVAGAHGRPVRWLA